MMGSIIALGSNLGDRQRNIQSGINALKKLGSIKLSEPYLETPDESGLGPSYINTVVLLRTTGVSPKELLETLLRIEMSLGRDRSKRCNAPRTLDLDIIYIEGIKGSWSWSTPKDLIILGPMLTLELPHPRAYRRHFVTKPMQALGIDTSCLATLI